MLKQLFFDLTQKYTSNQFIIEKLWSEIEKKYTGPKRYYHTKTHLENLADQLNSCKKQIQDWDTMLFSVFYHDIIYNTLKQDNEEKSADLAQKRLQAIGIPDKQITTCKNQIIATKSHKVNQDPDTNLFTDADLSVLGMPWEMYTVYYQQIRKEYCIYPDLIYKTGRRKVLQHFLDMQQIYKTEFFRNKFETQAQENVGRELLLLTK